jgi:hypothetical protein
MKVDLITRYSMADVTYRSPCQHSRSGLYNYLYDIIVLTSRSGQFCSSLAEEHPATFQTPSPRLIDGHKLISAVNSFRFLESGFRLNDSWRFAFKHTPNLLPHSQFRNSR